MLLDRFFHLPVPFTMTYGKCDHGKRKSFEFGETQLPDVVARYLPQSNRVKKYCTGTLYHKLAFP